LSDRIATPRISSSPTMDSDEITGIIAAVLAAFFFGSYGVSIK
jgi:hypothetical protein